MENHNFLWSIINTSPINSPCSTSKASWHELTIWTCEHDQNYCKILSQRPANSICKYILRIYSHIQYAYIIYTNMMHININIYIIYIYSTYIYMIIYSYLDILGVYTETESPHHELTDQSSKFPLWNLGQWVRSPAGSANAGRHSSLGFTSQCRDLCQVALLWDQFVVFSALFFELINIENWEKVAASGVRCTFNWLKHQNSQKQQKRCIFLRDPGLLMLDSSNNKWLNPQKGGGIMIWPSIFGKSYGFQTFFGCRISACRQFVQPIRKPQEGSSGESNWTVERSPSHHGIPKMLVFYSLPYNVRPPSYKLVYTPQ